MKEDIENIYSRKDGRFEIRYHYGYKEDGTSNYRSVYGSSEEEVVENYKTKIEELFKNNDLLIFDKSYIGYDINSWMNNSKIKNKKSTYSNYQYTLKSRIIPKFAKVKKKVISLELINKFTADLLNEGLAAKSVKDILIILQQILRTGDINIKIPMPKVPKNEIQILNNEEQTKLESELISNLTETSFGIYFCLYTGLRIGELCALQWKNIDLQNKKMFVKQTLGGVELLQELISKRGEQVAKDSVPILAEGIESERRYELRNQRKQFIQPEEIITEQNAPIESENQMGTSSGIRR